eukprot:15446075-Alexandrium_andersonii.AAC.1
MLARGILSRAPPAMLASSSLLLGSLRWSAWPSSGHRGSSCAAGAWSTCSVANLHVQAAQLLVRTFAAQNAILRVSTTPHFAAQSRISCLKRVQSRASYLVPCMPVARTPAVLPLPLPPGRPVAGVHRPLLLRVAFLRVGGLQESGGCGHFSAVHVQVSELGQRSKAH